jgi:hypothetical protein
MTDIVLKVLRAMAGTRQLVVERSTHAVLESTWVVSGEPAVSKRRGPGLRRGTFPPKSGLVALKR